MNGPELSRSLRLTDAAVPTCSLNVEVPWPIDERLDRLVELIHAEDLGPSSKRELAAALVQTAPTSGLELWDRVLRLRRSTVGDTAFWLPDDTDVCGFRARRAGRRRRSGTTD